ncbi:MAG: hypothetical protein BWX66_02030 [Deltaproteobacteria bacterium ADurb.Bin058]|nr:MAG: hypothetical protein BWX66_02030 [Deltaproteobacteria bacterium ADurb.Bin058]
MRASMHVMACLVVLGLFTACGIDEYYTNIGTGAVPGQPLFKGNQKDKEPVECTCNCVGGGGGSTSFTGKSWVMDTLVLGDPLVDLKDMVNDVIKTEMGKGTLNVLLSVEDDDRETGILTLLFGAGEKSESDYSFGDGASTVDATLVAASGAFAFNSPVAKFAVTIPMEEGDPISIPITNVVLKGTISPDGGKISGGTLEGLLTVEDAKNTTVLFDSLYNILRNLEHVEPDNDMDGDSEMDSWVFSGTFTAKGCTVTAK